MNDRREIAMKAFAAVMKTYLIRRPFWLWSVFWGCEVACYAALVVSRFRAHQSLGIVIGFGVGYSWAAIGIQLKEQLAAYRSATIPGFRLPHLFAAVFWLIVVLLPYALLPVFYNQSALGSLALCLPLGAAAFAGASLGGWRIGVFMVPYLALFSASVSRFAYRFIAGDFPFTSVVLCGIGLWWTVDTLLTLWKMNEEDPQYLFRIRMKVRAMRGPDARKAAADDMNQLEKRHSIWLRPIDWFLPEQRAFAGDTRLHRIIQWRRAHANWPAAAIMPVIIWGMIIIIQYIAEGMGTRGMIWGTVWTLVFLPQMTFLSSWQVRAALLERELTYPVQRRDFVLENAVSFLSVQYLSWLLMIIPFTFLAACTGILSITQIVLTVLMTAGWQLVAFSLNARLSTGRSAVSAYVGAFSSGLPGTILLIVVLKIQLLLPIAGIAVFIAGTAWLLSRSAYRHWMTVDVF